jgi:hypothetical protein
MAMRPVVVFALAIVSTLVVLPREVKARKTYWAVVNADGTLARSNGKGRYVSNVTGLGVGHYYVNFHKDVTNCAYSATTSGGFAGQIGVEDAGPNDQNGVVVVYTVDSAGNLASQPFHLIVTCK